MKKWDSSDALRGLTGIHAARMPYDWKRANLTHHEELSPYAQMDRGQLVVIGVVERFGKYVLGTEGWRAEIVLIRALGAPNNEVGLALEQAYPEVEVCYEDR